MPIEMRDGFKFYTNDVSSLIVESESLDACTRHIQDAKITAVAINSFLGYGLPTITFLRDCPHIERVSIYGKTVTDLSPLYDLPMVTRLTLADNEQPLDLSLMPRLEHISLDWHPKVKSISQCTRLQYLHMTGYKPASHSLAELAPLGQITSLILTKTPITSFCGCGDWKNLESIEVNYLSRMESIDELERNAGSLRSLLFYSSKKLRNHDYVACLSQLEVLAFNNCGTIRSIEFIQRMPNLKDFRFVETTITDGNVSPCMKLEYAAFSAKKHYSHTPDQITQLIEQRNATSKH